ncbi:hypothetical protein [Persephonella sp.]
MSLSLNLKYIGKGAVMNVVDILIVSVVVIGAVLFLYKKFKKDIQRGKCASCPVYGECESEKKV